MIEPVVGKSESCTILPSTSGGRSPVAHNPDPLAIESATREVKEFVIAHNLQAHLETALSLAMATFPTGSVVSLQTEEDLDADGKWLVINLDVRASVDDALRCYHKFVEQWIGVAPPWVGNLIRVTFNLS